jgi:purine-cytosine permease-like protein
MNIVILLALLVIVGTLAGAGFFMLRRGQKTSDRPGRMARALAWRVGLSIALFLMVLFAYSQGWIAPRGIPLGH